MDSYDHLPICTACGTLYDVQNSAKLKRCTVCDDPRQFVLASGTTFTTLPELREDHNNVFHHDAQDGRIWSIVTEPKFAIGQRAMLLETPNGNILWDLISLLDQATVDKINSIGSGGLKAIVISHPHFYTTLALWSQVFECPVYVASEDQQWLFSRPKEVNLLKVVEQLKEPILPGITAIKCGGHFPGSMCLHWEKHMFVSDTIFTVPTSRNPDENYFEGKTNTFSFMWSIPNQIPLDPVTIHQIWSRLKPFEFESTYGNILGADVRKKDVKRRILESAQIQARHMGWEGKEEGDLLFQEKM